MAQDLKRETKNPRYYNGESVYHYSGPGDKRSRAKIKKTKQDRAGNFYYDIQLDDDGENRSAVPAAELKRIKQKAPTVSTKAKVVEPKDTDQSTSAKSRCPRKIALDNDECLGGFRLLSVLYQIHRYHQTYNKNERFGDSSRETFMELVCEYYLARRGTRPHLARLFRTIMQLKLMKKVDEVYMYTSAENVDGWVEFLKDALERFANTPGMYDEVFSRKSLVQIRASCGATKKDLLNVATNSKKITMGKTKDDHMTSNILMFDDKPHNVNNRDGTIIGVRAYYDWPNWDDIVGLVKAHPGMTEFAKWAWQGWDKFERELFKHFDPKRERVDLSEDGQVDLMIKQIQVLYDIDIEQIREPGQPTRRHTERLMSPPLLASVKAMGLADAGRSSKASEPKGVELKMKFHRSQTAPDSYDIPMELADLEHESKYEAKTKVYRSESIFVKSNHLAHLDPMDRSPSSGMMIPPTTPDVRKGAGGFKYDDATIKKGDPSAGSPHGKDTDNFAI